MEPWNNAILLPPPVHTSKMKACFDVDELKHICTNIIKILSKQSPLHREGAIFSRLIYKFDKKFRNDIGYRHFKKVNIALKKYLTMNILKDIENFTTMLTNEQDECYYPTRQMLEYVLIKLMTFSKIMLRINICTKKSAIFYLYRIKKGDMHWMCLMPYALVSRVWSISKVLLQHSSQWYTRLYFYLDKLQYKGLQYLPEGYILPDHIKDWLGIDDLDDIARFEWKQNKFISIDPNFICNEDADDNINILDFVNQINEDDNIQDEPEAIAIGVAYSNNVLEVPKAIKIDQGEVVSREKFNVLHNFQNKMKYDKIKHTFGTVTSAITLKEFLDIEETFRNENNKLSLTKHLSLMQWHALKKALLNACSIVGSDWKIQRKLEKIWKDKCLDYF